jgi:hypothetical protein
MFLSVGLSGRTVGASLEGRRPTAGGPRSRLGTALPARRALEGVSFVRRAHDVRIGRCGGASGPIVRMAGNPARNGGADRQPGRPDRR